MSPSSSALRDLARRLLAASRPASASRAGEDSGAPAAVTVCARLRIAVSKFAGADGFAALLRRALTLARRDFPTLQSVRLGTDCRLEGLEEAVTGKHGADAAVALATHVLALLVTFIGEPLTLRLVREGWPDIDTTPDVSP